MITALFCTLVKNFTYIISSWWILTSNKFIKCNKKQFMMNVEMRKLQTRSDQLSHALHHCYSLVGFKINMQSIAIVEFTSINFCIMF